MTLNELKTYVDEYVRLGHGDNSVLINLSEPSMGARAATPIALIYPGIDWEHNQMRINPKDALCRLGRSKDDVLEMHIFVKAGPRKLYTCPTCGEHLKKDFNYCSRCGQRVRYNSDAIPRDV